MSVDSVIFSFITILLSFIEVNYQKCNNINKLFRGELKWNG